MTHDLTNLDTLASTFFLRERLREAAPRRTLEVQLEALEALDDMGEGPSPVRAAAEVLRIFRD